MDLSILGITLPYIFVALAFITPLIALKIKNSLFYSLLTVFIGLIAIMGSSYLFISSYRYNKYFVYPFGGWPPPIGIVYEIDLLNSWFGLIAVLLFTLISIYNIWYYRKIEGCEWLTTLLLLLMAGILGCIYTGDIFNLFVMLEVLCISSYGLTSFFKKRKWAIEAASSYAFTGYLITTLFFFTVVFIYAAFGTLNMADITTKANNLLDYARILTSISGGVIGRREAEIASAIAVALMIWTMTFEAGLYPNNFWLPSAYTEAPTPASAMFAGIVDKVGTYVILRTFLTLFATTTSTLAIQIYGVPLITIYLEILGILGIISAYLGALLMIFQRDVKRFLSYSTISHIGLIFSAIPTLNPFENSNIRALGLTAILIHILVHSFSESSLFLGMGTFSTIVGSRDISSISGLGLKFKAIGIGSTINILVLLGILPPGLISKYLLFSALLYSGRIFYALSIVIVSGISAIGYLRLVRELLTYKKEISREKSESLYIPSIVIICFTLILIAISIAILTTPLLDNINNIFKDYVDKNVIRYIREAEKTIELVLKTS